MGTPFHSNTIRMVTFDYDDTLVATFAAKSRLHKFIAKRYFNVDLDDSTIRKHWGKPLLELRCTLYQTDNRVAATEASRRHEREFPKVLYPDTISTIINLRQAGILTGLITASDRFQVGREFTELDIGLTSFDFVQTHDESEFHKPDPRVFNQLLSKMKQLGIKPSQILYVGDGLIDGTAARGAGLQFVGVTTGLTNANEFEQHGFSSISSLRSLLKLLKNL